MTELPYANDMNYWKTSRSGVDAWLGKAEDLIERHDGIVLMRAMGKSMGRSALCMEFEFGQDRFKALWPVLPTKNTGEQRAAEIQAATMLYHDVKARCMKIAIFGPRLAFFDMLMLPDGTMTGQMADSELMDKAPRFLLEHQR